ncbi:mycofactocin-associated electron transfer flavoprotein beta subunit [Nocardiopsis ansamitocini]|uniref:Electron transfer flavoprotein alpha/beta-subunit N-terminal domain-containing protein n=1 Tax=Nocardiopsis ansamitocini TaxID=1670832 RepID=A0A9W6P6M3_9ACTN|nr:mycofactocin-associated electron transfer flavoprotein beta subunit [Nocardiopsis ansamitocini]GLU48150.1 hypothetical protein Nans01_25010 [Nocardiopsis ansamitocini]
MTQEHAPLIVVAVRHDDHPQAITPLNGIARPEGHTSALGEADRCAVEHGLRIAEELDGRCVVVAMGQSVADAALRVALAAGAAEVLRIESSRAGVGDEDGVAAAEVLDAALVSTFGPPDLVLCADRFADSGAETLSSLLAVRFGATHARGLLELTADDGETTLTALRRLDEGRRERLTVPLPAVCSVEPGSAILREATLPATVRAGRAGVPVLVVAAEPAPVTRLASVHAYRPRSRVEPATGPTDPHGRLMELVDPLVLRDSSRGPRAAGPAEPTEELLSSPRGRGYLPADTA